MSSVQGFVQAISPKPGKDHMGIMLDSEEWFNGNDKDIPSMSKGDKVKIEHHNGWINKIDVIEESNKDGTSREPSDAGKNSGEEGKATSGTENSSNKNTSLSPRQANITAQAATRLAAEMAATRPEDNHGEHIEEVSQLANGYTNIITNITGGLQE